MAARVQCNNCGGKVDLPAGHARAKIRCPGCGYYAEVPPELRASEPAFDDDTPFPVQPAAAPPPPDPADEPLRPGVARPTKKAARTPAKAPEPDDTDTGPPLLEGTQDEHDDEARPYTVPGDGTKKCPACRKVLPLAATFCVHCGGDLTAGRKKKRTFQPVDLTWESRWPLKTRLAVFLGLQALNIAALVAMTVFGSGAGTIGLSTVVFNALMQAFLIGSYETLRVRRTARGQATLTKTWRIAFIPKPPETIEWQDNHATGIVATNHSGMFEWMMFLYLLVCTACPPIGIAFYFLTMVPDRYEVALCDVYGSTDAIVFRTTNRDTAHEVCSTIADCTGLTYRPVM
jgi:hypothetical protein